MRSYDGESSSCEEDERREAMPEAHLQQGPWQRSASHPTWAWEHRSTVSSLPALLPTPPRPALAYYERRLFLLSSRFADLTRTRSYTTLTLFALRFFTLFLSLHWTLYYLLQLLKSTLHYIYCFRFKFENKYNDNFFLILTYTRRMQ